MKNYLEEVLKLLKEGIRELGLELKSEGFTLRLSHLFKNNISWGKDEVIKHLGERYAVLV